MTNMREVVIWQPVVAKLIKPQFPKTQRWWQNLKFSHQ